MRTKKTGTKEALQKSAKIKQFRQLCRTPQQEVAKQCNVLQGVYSKMESGKTIVSAQVYEYLLSRFKTFRVVRIKELENEIKELKKIV